MSLLSQILGGSARLDLLLALHYQDEAVGLRQLARLAGVHPHSAERMLKDLVSEGLVLRSHTQNRTWFLRNREHADWCILSAVFDAADRAARKMQSDRLNERARVILPLIEEADTMLKKARGRTRVA